MPTINKELQSLTLCDIEKASERFLMGWHDPKYDGHNYRIRGLNHRRAEFGLQPLTKEWSMEYRIDYIQKHYTYDEIQSAIEHYIRDNRVGDTRWSGIEILDCRFGRDYVKAFRRLLGSAVWRKISECNRVVKLVETQKSEYGGVGVGGKAAYEKMLGTKYESLMRDMEVFKAGGNFNARWFGSMAEETVFSCLVSKFGRKDVFFQYGLHPYDKRYPYPCDFYIKSLDLFIELHVHYSHGRHWFDENNPDDVLRLKNLSYSCSNKVRKSIDTWTVTDIKKRNKAKESGIRYLVFWDGKHHRDSRRTDGYGYSPRLEDFFMWFLAYECDYESFVRDFPGNTY